MTAITDKEPPRTPACWAWLTVPLPPAICTCVGCTNYRAERDKNGSTSEVRP